MHQITSPHDYGWYSDPAFDLCGGPRPGPVEITENESVNQVIDCLMGNQKLAYGWTAKEWAEQIVDDWACDNPQAEVALALLGDEDVSMSSQLRERIHRKTQELANQESPQC